MKTYRWNLDQFLRFVRARKASPARLGDVSVEMIQTWMDDMPQPT